MKRGKRLAGRPGFWAYGRTARAFVAQIAPQERFAPLGRVSPRAASRRPCSPLQRADLRSCRARFLRPPHAWRPGLLERSRMEPPRALLAASPANRIMPTCFRPGQQRPAIHPTSTAPTTRHDLASTRRTGGESHRAEGAGISLATCRWWAQPRPLTVVTPDLIRGPAIHLRELRDGSRIKSGMTSSLGLDRWAGPWC